MSVVVGLPNNSYKPITNTACVRTRLGTLQKRMHSTRSVPVTCPWSVVLSGYSASATTKTGLHDILEILLKVALKHQQSINQIKYYKALGRRKTKQKHRAIQYMLDTTMCKQTQ